MPSASFAELLKRPINYVAAALGPKFERWIVYTSGVEPKMFMHQDEKVDPEIISQDTAAQLQMEPRACPYWFPLTASCFGLPPFFLFPCSLWYDDYCVPIKY